MNSVFYNSSNFKLMEAGIKIAQAKQDMHTHNIANLDTPGYKAKAMVFKDVLTAEKNNRQEITGISVEIKDTASSSRPDENNVDYESESLGLYKTYVQQTMLLSKIKSQFENYSSVLNSSIK